MLDSVPIDFRAAKKHLMSTFPWIHDVDAYREPTYIKRFAVIDPESVKDPETLFRVKVNIRTYIHKRIVWYIGYGAPDEQDIEELRLALEDWSKTNLP